MGYTLVPGLRSDTILDTGIHWLMSVAVVGINDNGHGCCWYQGRWEWQFLVEVMMAIAAVGINNDGDGHFW